MKHLDYNEARILSSQEHPEVDNRILSIIADADTTSISDMSILIDIFNKMDMYMKPGWVRMILNKFTESGYITHRQAQFMINHLPSYVFYSNCLDEICKFCLQKNVVIKYEKFKTNLFIVNDIYSKCKSFKYVIEYFTKYPVPIKVFDSWIRNSTDIKNSPFWLAVFYLSIRKNEYMDLFEKKYYMNINFNYGLINNYITLKNIDFENLNMSHIYSIINLFNALHDLTKEAYSLYYVYKPNIVNIVLDKIYSTIGLTEGIMNKCFKILFDRICPNDKYYESILKSKDKINKSIKALATICNICGFKISSENMSRFFDIALVRNKVDYTVNTNYGIEVNTINYMLKVAEDKNGGFITKDSFDYLSSNPNIKMRIHFPNKFIEDLVTYPNIDKYIYGIYSISYIKNSDYKIPYKVLEKIADLHVEWFNTKKGIGSILESYPKSMIDRKVMTKWNKSKNEALKVIAESYFYHTNHRFDYSDRWGILYNPDNPNKDLDITSKDVIIKNGSFDSVIYGKIPDDAIIRKVIIGVGETYRTNKFIVTKVESPFKNVAFSANTPSFAYVVGETIEIEDFEPTNDYGPGIYFDDPNIKDEDE